MTLEVKTSKGVRTVPLIDQGKGFYIGSSEKCHLVITKSESEFVGREHAYIYYCEASNTYILEDLDSLNGVFVIQEDGQIQRINHTEVHSNMQFYIADVLVSVQQNNPFIQKINHEQPFGNFQKV